MAVNSLISINLSDRQDVFLTCSYKPGQKLRIILLDLNECKAFTGHATDLDLRKQAATIQMSFSDFESLTEKALIQNDQDDEQFLYSLENNFTEFLFKWKNVDEEETIIEIGSVKLIESDYQPMIKDIFLMLSKEMLTLNKKVLTLNKELTDVKKKRDDALQLLSDTTGVKERVEKELYSKFTIVLNEKKQKIRELKQKVNDSLSSDVNSNKDKKRRYKFVHRISESSDEAPCDVDEMDVPGPSTSKRNNSLLFMDDDVSNDLRISPSKRRNRNKTTVNKTINLLESKASIKGKTAESESEDELFKNL